MSINSIARVIGLIAEGQTSTGLRLNLNGANRPEARAGDAAMAACNSAIRVNDPGWTSAQSASDREVIPRALAFSLRPMAMFSTTMLLGATRLFLRFSGRIARLRAARRTLSSNAQMLETGA